MNQILDESSDWEETVKPANRRLRISMMVLDISLVFNGIILIVLGVHLNDYVTSTSPAEDPPPIWALGILPIILGFVGIVCIMLKARKWVALWLLLCVILGVSSFMSFTLFRMLDPSVYGISIQIFGECHSEGTHCKCLWDRSGQVLGVVEASCQYVRRTSSLFLAMICLFILSTATTVICAILGCVVTFCLRLCAPLGDQPQNLHTTIYGANMLPSNGTLYHPGYCLVSMDEHLANAYSVGGRCERTDALADRWLLPSTSGARRCRETDVSFVTGRSGDCQPRDQRRPSLDRFVGTPGVTDASSGSQKVEKRTDKISQR